ncbi:jg23332, partial [Pararge aegeria aegeria]
TVPKMLAALPLWMAKLIRWPRLLPALGSPVDSITLFDNSLKRALASGPHGPKVSTPKGTKMKLLSRSSGESELSVGGGTKEKKDKKGVFGGLFSRKKRPQSHM